MGDASRSLVKHEIYPPCCFDLAPTHNKWCFLRAADIRRLKQPEGFPGQEYYFYKNLPIRWTRIVGLVVAIDQVPKRRIFTIDDSSGVCIEAVTNVINEPTLPQTSVNNASTTGQSKVKEATRTSGNPKTATQDSTYDAIAVGDVVDIKACITTFREQRQINIEKILVVRSTMEELALWERRDQFRADVLHVPWVLSRERIKKCQRRATRSDEAAARKKRKRLQSQTKEPLSQKPGESENKPRESNKLSSRKHQTVDITAFIEDGGAKGKFSALGL